MRLRSVPSRASSNSSKTRNPSTPFLKPTCVPNSLPTKNAKSYTLPRRGAKFMNSSSDASSAELQVSQTLAVKPSLRPMAKVDFQKMLREKAKVNSRGDGHVCVATTQSSEFRTFLNIDRIGRLKVSEGNDAFEFAVLTHFIGSTETQQLSLKFWEQSVHLFS